MTAEQKTIAKGALVGVLGAAALTWFFYTLLPTPTFVGDTPLERIMHTFRWNAVLILPLFVMLVTIGNRRFLSGGINPLKDTNDETFTVDERVATNTLEQTCVFFIGLLALATFLPVVQMKLIAALVLVFVIARFVFWFGYRRHYLYRAPGMAATYILNLFILVAVLMHMFA